MKPRMGMNVVFVRLLASENKNDVAAETGELKFSYSSEGRKLYIAHWLDIIDGAHQQKSGCSRQDLKPTAPAWQV